jgi:hypothetical protein
MRAGPPGLFLPGPYGFRLLSNPAGRVTPAKEKQMPDKKYTQEDFEAMNLKVGALKNFAELLDCNYDRKADGPALASIALIIKTLLDPVEDFLSWAYTYAEIPEEEPETIAQ